MRRVGVRLAPFTAIVTCALALSACGGSSGSRAAGDLVEVQDQQPSRLHGTEIGEVIPRPSLRLRDTADDVFDLRDRPRGELTVVFFGYTRCRDVCPTTMAALASAERALSVEQRALVRVVFVTEDPRNDTAPVLRTWLDGFDRGFVGLIGGNASTAAALTALKAPATEVLATSGPTVASSASEEAETVEHGGSVYAFLGDRVVVYTGGTTPNEYAADFRELLS